MTGAALHRGSSKQDYGTPDDFLLAVLRKFHIGAFQMDLACTPDNLIDCALSCYPEDSLLYDWSQLRGDNWLNPPFSHITPWAEKCSEVQKGRIFLLTPASVGAVWYRDFVHGQAAVYFLCGRIRFKGATDYYPKDCMLSVFGEGVVPHSTIWTWREDT